YSRVASAIRQRLSPAPQKFGNNSGGCPSTPRSTTSSARRGRGLRKLVVPSRSTLAETCERRGRPLGTALPPAVAFFAVDVVGWTREEAIGNVCGRSSQTGRDAGGSRRQLGGPRDDELGISVACGIDDFRGRALAVNGHERHRTRNGKPGEFPTMLSFEPRVEDRAGPHQ